MWLVSVVLNSKSQHYTSNNLNDNPLNDLFNRVAHLSALTAKAPVTYITLRVDRKLHILGQYGLFVRNFDDSWNMGAKLVRQNSMVFVPNVALDPNLKGHPLLKAAPFTRSIAHIPVQGEHADIEAAVGIINPEIKWPFSAPITAILTNLAMLVGDALKGTAAISELGLTMPNATPSVGLHEQAHHEAPRGPSKDTAGQFLLSTLSSQKVTPHPQ